MAVSEENSRRSFIRKTIYLVGFGALANTPLQVLAKQRQRSLTILHTNDWHSRIEPFPASDKNYGGRGGAEVRTAMIDKIRAEEGEILLLDAGDIFQGTPYFNFYGGELEYKLMSRMGYDCVTLGNHDFDAGINGLVKQLPHAAFDIVNANYSFQGTALEGKIKPYRIYRKKGLKIGVFGVGIELKGLVPDNMYEGIVYNDPIAVANKVALELKHKHHCDMVICLSHLGYQYKNNKVSDEVLARSTQNIDLIIGGHTHTFLPEPVFYTNVINRKVCVNQVGWAGLQMGRLKCTFEPFVNTGISLTGDSMSVVNIG